MAEIKAAIWPYASPSKSNLAFLIAHGLKISGLALWLSFRHFWGEFGIEDFCLALSVIFGFFVLFCIV